MASGRANHAWRAGRYAALAIETSVTLRIVFHLALRQTEGLIGSIIDLLRLDLAVPDHSTLSRRARTLRVAPEARTATGPLHLLVDSTGLKLGGPGEWLIQKHGTRGGKSWRKLHLGVDAETGTIVASTLTSKNVDDVAQLNPLLDQVEGLVASVTADGAYDQTGVYDTVAEHHPDAAVIVPPRRCRARRRKPIRRRATTISRSSPSAAAWAGRRLRATNQRAKAEAAVSRYKRVIGGTLRSQGEPAQEVETQIAAKALNLMLSLGRPDSVHAA